MKEKTLQEEILYSGKILNLKKLRVELENGIQADREIVEHNGAVAVIAEREGKMLFVKQFRKAYEEYVLEIPAGKLEIGEEPLTCAKRELEEETGYRAEEWKLLQLVYPSPGFCTEKIYLFQAGNLSQGVAGPDEDENLEVHWLTLAEVKHRVHAGEIRDAKSLAGILHRIME